MSLRGIVEAHRCFVQRVKGVRIDANGSKKIVLKGLLASRYGLSSPCILGLSTGHKGAML